MAQYDPAVARGTACANVNGPYARRFPLSVAAQKNDLEMVQLLVEHGADVNGKDDDGTPLSQTHSPQVRNYLVQKGVR